MTDRTADFPPAVGRRRSWREVALAVRREVESLLRSSVVETRSVTSGFSPGVAARVRLANDGRAFVKVGYVEWNRETVEAHRREAEIAGRLPAEAHAPRLIGFVDDDQWIALVFEDVEGRPPRLPWRQDELGRVLDTLTEVSTALTPSPIDVEPLLPDADEFPDFRQMQAVQESGEDALDDVDPWIVANLDRLAALEAQAPEASQGATLVHFDVRADNLLLTPERVWIVDWPHAGRAAPWVELIAMLPSVAMQHGPDPETLFANHPIARSADREAVNAMLAALAGMFVGQSRRPAPPGIPTLRAFQRSQGIQAVAWLRRRTGWR